MRWPIRVQLMLATLLVTTTATVLACAASVYLAVSVAARSKAAELSRIEKTLAQATYPLTENVLQQMQGLSGAEFVLLDGEGRLVSATVELDEADLALLKSTPTGQPIESLAEAPVIRLSDQEYFGHTIPTARAGTPSAGRSLVVLYGKDQWWAVARRVALPIIGAGLVAIVLAVALATLIAGWLVRPIQILKAQSERIAAGRFDPVELAPRNDELADLAASINRMTERLKQYEKEVRKSEQLRTLDQLGAGMAHTLRNAATGARLAIEIFQRRNPQLDQSDSLDTALHQLELMESFIQKFLRLGQRSSGTLAMVDLTEVADGALQLVRPSFDHAHVRLEATSPPGPVHVKGDPESLRELILNLLLNGLEATGGKSGNETSVVLEIATPDTCNAEIHVSDSGPGPDPATSKRMFEPFVSEKPEGTGLGLYLSQQVAEAHGGTIRWQRNGDRTEFVVRLPVADAPQPEDPPMGNRS